MEVGGIRNCKTSMFYLVRCTHTHTHKCLFTSLCIRVTICYKANVYAAVIRGLSAVAVYKWVSVYILYMCVGVRVRVCVRVCVCVCLHVLDKICHFGAQPLGHDCPQFAPNLPPSVQMAQRKWTGLQPCCLSLTSSSSPQTKSHFPERAKVYAVKSVEYAPISSP